MNETEDVVAETSQEMEIYQFVAIHQMKVEEQTLVQEETVEMDTVTALELPKVKYGFQEKLDCGKAAIRETSQQLAVNFELVIAGVGKNPLD